MKPSTFSIALLLRPLCLALAATLGGMAFAEPPPQTVDAVGESASKVQSFPEIRAALKMSVPKLEIDDIRPSPVPGIYAVVIGSSIVYTDQTGRYVFTGHLVDATTKEDLTQTLLSDLTHIDPKTLPLADSFTEIRGNGKRQMYVFSDPDCPFCKQLEQELPKINDVTVHVFLYPLVSIHPTAHTNAISIWCSKDRAGAWKAKMLQGVIPKASTCENPVDRNIALGGTLKISGTPTIIFSDGKVVAGVIPTEQIEAMLGPAS